MEEEKKEIKKPNNTGGRPKKSDHSKKSKTIGVRFSAFDRELIKQKAKKAGLKECNYIRQAAIEAKVRRLPTPEEIALFRDVIGIGNNLNQLTKLAHQERLGAISTKLVRLLDELNRTLDKLRNIDN